MNQRLTVTWNEEGTSGWISGHGIVHRLTLVANWYVDQTVEPTEAWVVEFMTSPDDPLHRSLIELGSTPATTNDRRQTLLEEALRIAALGPPAIPDAFACARIGARSLDEVRNQVELISHSLQDAVGRVDRATRSDIAWAATAIAAGVFEVMAWLRALDEVFETIWQDSAFTSQRQAISAKVDAYIARSPGVAQLITENERQLRSAGQPYDDWAIALISRGETIPRQELLAFRWLAGRLLHQGPMSVAELAQWRAGEKPIWKWREPDDFLPKTGPRDRYNRKKTFEETVAGKSIQGSLNFTTALIEAEFMFFSLLREEPIGSEKGDS